MIDEEKKKKQSTSKYGYNPAPIVQQKDEFEYQKKQYDPEPIEGTRNKKKPSATDTSDKKDK